MAADTLSSASITNLDASPVVANTAGAGARAHYDDVSDYVTPTALGLQNTGSKYKMVRLPTYAKVKRVELSADGALDTSTGLALDVGAYYSDSTVDGTPVALQGTVISAAAFASQLASFQSSAKGVVAADTAWTAVKRNQPLWQALGLSSDPGGFIDIVVAVHTAATTGTSNVLGALVKITT